MSCPQAHQQPTASEPLWLCDGPGCAGPGACAGHALLTLARAGGRERWLCGRCVAAVGWPLPVERPGGVERVRAVEQAARERMLRKGGPERYMVLKGRA